MIKESELIKIRDTFGFILGDDLYLLLNLFPGLLKE